ncbi:MAG: ABC-F family ATP-binding cassette domain-containing protein [Myxococcota bacterium]|nr:ABC-F family ATP-binding cassette domain-containing protein [Myxococcota bacterium]
MSLVAVHKITKRYGDRTVLDNVSFSIQARDRIGLIGANGSGKSTLLRILMQTEEPDDGQIMRRRGLSIAFVEQDPKFPEDATVQDIVSKGLQAHQGVLDELSKIEEQIAQEAGTEVSQKLEELLEHQTQLTDRLEQLGGWNVEHLAEAAMSALRVPPKDRQVASLSLGERRRLALCVALTEARDLLILDEPTNHLDVEAIDWLEKTIADYPGAILMVSHDRYLLDRTVFQLLEIDRGDMHHYDGNYTAFMVAKAERYALEAKTEERRQKAISQELQWARKTAPARTTKQKARLDRLDEVMANAPKTPVSETKFRIPYPPRISKTILELVDVGHGFPGKKLFENLNLIMKKGDRLGIVGPNGAGKSTLIKLILEHFHPEHGRIIRGPNTEIIYVDQGRTDLDPEKSLLEAVSEDGDFVFIGEDAVPIQGFLQGLLFDGAAQRMKVSGLSGGERSRAVLAKHLCRRGNLIILDEPTNDLDLPSLRVLEEALVTYPGCALVVSHDRYFLDRIATGILAFEGHKVTFYEGNYSQYIDLKSEVEVKAVPGKKEASQKPAPRAKKETSAKKKRTYREEQEFAGIEDRILEAETKVSELEELLNNPDALRDLGPEVSAKVKELETAREHVEQLYARWEELAQYS